MRIPTFSQMAIAFEKLAGPTHSPLWRGDEAHTSNVVGGVCGGSSGGGVVVVVVVFAATATCSRAWVNAYLAFLQKDRDQAFYKSSG